LSSRSLSDWGGRGRPRSHRTTRVTHNLSGFQIFVQNAEELSRHPDYVRTVSGIGKEELFYYGIRRPPADEVRWSVKQLDHFNEAGKPVLGIYLVTERAKIDAFS
jgi:uncharacterized protein (TIGR01370 family)